MYAFAICGDEIARRSEIERPAESPAKIEKLDDDGKVLRKFAVLGDGIARRLEIERPGRSLAEIEEFDDDGKVLRVDASSGVQLCLKKSLSHLYGGERPLASEAKDVSSKRRKLSSWMISARKKKSKPRRAVEAERKVEYRGPKQ